MPKNREEKCVNGTIHLICSVCKKYFPATKEYFEKTPTGKYGFSSGCKDCYKKRRKELYSTEKGRRHRENRKESLKKYFEENRERRCKQKREHHYKNRDRLNQISKMYYIKNKERLNKLNKEYYIKNRETLKEYGKKYYSSERGRESLNRNSRIRRARKRNVLCNLTKKEWNDALHFFEGKCAYCGNDNDITMDHVIPLSSGGNHVKNNIVPACKHCNCSKQNKDVETWYKTHSNYSVDKLEKIYKWITLYSDRKYFEATV